jgi:hypothetical protein
MALMTVGGGAVLVGRDLLGERIAVDLGWVLWPVKAHKDSARA